MRIWIQSAAPESNDPLWTPYKESLHKMLLKVKREDTEIEFHGIHYAHELMDHSIYVRFLCKNQIIENAIRAEREGFDGFAISNSLDIDLGCLEIRNVVDIPVVFLAEISLHVASMLADTFSILSWNKPLTMISRRTVKEYGLERKFIPCEDFETTEVEALKAFQDPTSITLEIKRIAEDAIDKGAGILVPFCNLLNMVLQNAGLKEIQGIPILNTTAMIVKGIEFMVELKRIGIHRPGRGLYSALTKEELSDVRSTFRLD
ncbi:MAG: aspartate/glutamate racemase family protein [Desulfatiglandaceae bacterium]|jgi:allantoin racemase